nr:TPA_asm: m44.8 sORF 3 [Murid betaherpesvirus 1]DBA07783.1 TPA_asm: m44.8 sORF 3 [Murid betaherpesvirus 1]
MTVIVGVGGRISSLTGSPAMRRSSNSPRTSSLTNEKDD